MNRRQVLSIAATTGSSLVSGCLSSNQNTACRNEENWEPEVEVASLELAPVEEGHLQIHAEPITSFSLRSPYYPCGSEPQVMIHSFSASPQPTGGSDKCPGSHAWDDCQAVDIAYTVTAEPSAEPGEYEYELIVGESLGERNTRSFERVITVSSE